jgi:KRAB domain-containing zinc finger protein
MHQKQNLAALPATTKSKTADLDKCPYCDKVFSVKAKKNPSLINSHIAVHTKPYKCDVEGCRVAFGNANSLRVHCVKEHPEMKIPSFRCPYADIDPGCSFTTAYSMAIKGHVRNKHNPNRNTHPCRYPGCNFVAATTASLNVHVGMVHERKKNFLCTECGYSSYQKADLRKHVQRRHTGENPFTCSICGRAFNDQYRLRYHQKTHESDRQREQVCEQCGKAYLGSDKLRRHIRLKHNQEGVGV